MWISQGILSQSQIEEIKNLYLWPQELLVERKPPLRLVSVFQLIGASLIGIGIIFYIAFNWQLFSPFIKLLITSGAMVISYIVGLFFFLCRPHYQRAGYTFIFLGNLLFGAGIWQVAQSYHIAYPFYKGFFIWGIGVVPFAFILGSQLSYFFSILLFFAWTLGESLGAAQPHIGFLFIFLGIMLPLTYYLKSKVGLGFCLSIGGIWLLINNIFWFERVFNLYLFIPLFLYGLILLVLHNFSLIKERLKDFSQVFLYLGVIILSLVIFLLPLSALFILDKPLNIRILSYPFWLATGLLLGIALSLKILTYKKPLDEIGVIVNNLFFYLLVTPLCIPLMFGMKNFLIITLLPPLIISLAYFYIEKSKVFLNFLMVYLLFWFPFCLINKWGQPLIFFLLLLVYGSSCYVLGWNYLSKDQRDWGYFFSRYGLAIIFSSLYVFSFDFLSREFSMRYIFPTSLDYWLLVAFFYTLSFFLLRNVVKFTCSLEKKGTLKGTLIEERSILPTLLIPPILFFIFSFKSIGLGYVFFINILFLSLILFSLSAGYRRDDNFLKVFSWFFLILLVGSRYLELGWSFLYKSILFIFTGMIILIVGIFLEKYKERLVVKD